MKKHARCDRPGKLALVVRYGVPEHDWLEKLTRGHVGYSLAQAIWDLEGEEPRQLVELHAAFVGARIALALVTDLTGDLCDFARSHHTCLTRMSNELNERTRGTVWDNRGLEVVEVVGWEGALAAIGEIAARACVENGTNDPYESPTFFGPRLWGTQHVYHRPNEAISSRSILPAKATLALIEPDVRPLDLSRGELIHEAEAAIDFEVAMFVAQLIDRPTLRRVRPFHRREYRDGPLPQMTDDARFLGEAELVAPVAEEADAWLRYYERCRGEFPDDQGVAFPAGTIRFRRLGAICDRCSPRRPPPCPPRSKPFRGPPPPERYAGRASP